MAIKLWAETYERPLRDVFAIQEKFSRAIAGDAQVRQPTVLGVTL
jgi:TolB-like protein